MKRFTVIAFTHKNLDLEEVGKLHLDDIIQEERLQNVKISMKLSELMYLSTCNRVEFSLVSEPPIDKSFLNKFFSFFAPDWSKEFIEKYSNAAEVYTGRSAIEHCFKVASSLDSMVVGEREIITQVRNAFEASKKMGITGDFIRLVIKHTVETAKHVYTDTNISRNPVSVVSLAYRQLSDLNVKLDARILVVGAGKTNTSMTKFLHKHGYTDFTIFNRTRSKADEMAKFLNGTSLALNDIENYKKGFDVIIACTASDKPIITEKVYEKLLNGETTKKVVIDLAIPNDFEETITKKYPVHLIQVSSLKSLAEKNIELRKTELEKCENIISNHIEKFVQVEKQRKLEVAMSDVPKKVKEIHQKAIYEVFAKEIEQLDEPSKEVLEKILTYVQKKYISVPMKMAREILIENE